MPTPQQTTATRFHPTALGLGMIAVYWVLGPQAALGDTPDANIRPPALIIDEAPPRFVPAKPRTEADADRLDALALFSAARIRENRKDYAEALRMYQRAFRCDPRSATIARAIVFVAIQLNRHAEAVRYALKLAELGEPDPPLLKRLAAYLTEIGEFKQALDLLEKAIRAGASAKPTAEDVAAWWSAGRLCFVTEKYAQAAVYLQQVVDALDRPDQFGLDAASRKALFGKPGPLFAMIGEAFLQTGHPEKAAAAFRKSHEAAPNAALLAYHLAQVDLKTGNPEAAIAKLQTYFDARQASEKTAPYRVLADALGALQKENELIPRLESLVRADPDNVWLGYFLAEQYFSAGKFDRAEKLYRDLLAKQPAVIGYRHLVEIYRKSKRFAELLTVLGEAADNLSSLEELETQKRPLAEDSELVRGVVEAARKQRDTDPKSLSYGARLAVALLAAEAKQFETAAEFFDLAIGAKPDRAAQLLLIWGLGLMIKEEHGRAAAVFRRGVEQNALGADDPTFLFHLAGALEMDGKTEPALDAARQAAARAAARAAAPNAAAPNAAAPKTAAPKTAAPKTAAPKTAAPKTATKAKEPNRAADELPRYLMRPAWVLYHAKRYDEAMQGYREVIEKFGQDYRSSAIREVVREARLVLSNLAVLKSDLPQAEEWLEQVLDEFPDDPSALNDLGYLWADQGKRLERAHRMIRRALEKEPENAAYLDSLGWVLFRRGQIREALIELEKAARLDPDPTVLDHLGEAYRAAGEKAKAIETWRKAAAAFRKAREEEKAKNVEAKIHSSSQQE